MGVLVHLLVAPLAEATAVASKRIKERIWTWVDVKGLGVEDLPMIHCLLDGRDPSESVKPAEWSELPFTKEKAVVTMLSTYMSAFELVAEDEEVAVLRVPPILTNVLAGLNEAKAAELTRKWSVAKSAERYGDGSPVPPFQEEMATGYIEHLTRMAKTAVQRNEELLVWACP
jgi:hypothetical protein